MIQPIFDNLVVVFQTRGRVVFQQIHICGECELPRVVAHKTPNIFPHLKRGMRLAIERDAVHGSDHRIEIEALVWVRRLK